MGRAKRFGLGGYRQLPACLSGLLVLSLAASCAEEETCNRLPGCQSATQVYVRSPDNLWQPGTYTFELETPEGAHACNFTLGLDPSAEPEFREVDCEPALDATFATELRCPDIRTLPCEPNIGHYHLELSFAGKPSFVALRLEHEGTVLLEEQRSESAYSQPGNVCRSDCELSQVTFRLP